MANTSSPVREAWKELDLLEEPSSISALVDEALRFARSVNHHAVLWRGLDNDQYRQCPGLARSWIDTTMISGRATKLARSTQSLLRKANEASMHWRDGHVFRGYTPVEQLALLQHAGTPTPLLDVTHSPFVALWFGSLNSSSNDGLLLGFSVPNSHLLRDPRKLANDEQLSWPKEPRFVVPPVVDERVRAQQAAFLLSPILGKKAVVSPVSDVKLPGVGNTVNGSAKAVALRINKGLKTELRKHLDRTYGINASTLFPDIAGFSALSQGAA